MVATISPKLFIDTLRELLQLERERKTVRLLSQNRAKAMAFMKRHQIRSPDDIIPVDRFQYLPHRAESIAEMSFNVRSNEKSFLD